MKRAIHLLATVLLLVGITAVAGATDKQLVAGAGPSTKVVQLFFSEFSTHPEAKNYEFVVPHRSTKHAGGIQSSDENIFGRTGRPLNAKEKGLNKDEIFLARVPIAFAVGSGAGVSALSLEELEGLYRRQITNWKQLGGADAEVVLVGREETEAFLTALKKILPFFRDAGFDQIFKKDHEVVNFLRSPEGKYAVGFGAKPNFSVLNAVKIHGFSAGVNVGLVYDLKVQDHALVLAAREYAGRSEWQDLVSRLGMLPPDK